MKATFTSFILLMLSSSGKKNQEKNPFFQQDLKDSRVICFASQHSCLAAFTFIENPFNLGYKDKGRQKCKYGLLYSSFSDSGIFRKALIFFFLLPLLCS